MAEYPRSQFREWKYTKKKLTGLKNSNFLEKTESRGGVVRGSGSVEAVATRSVSFWPALIHWLTGQLGAVVGQSCVLPRTAAADSVLSQFDTSCFVSLQRRLFFLELSKSTTSLNFLNGNRFYYWAKTRLSYLTRIQRDEVYPQIDIIDLLRKHWSKRRLPSDRWWGRPCPSSFSVRRRPSWCPGCTSWDSQGRHPRCPPPRWCPCPY